VLLRVLKSIKHHENGKKHKDTVQQFFFNKRKAKYDDERNQREIDKELRAMDKVVCFVEMMPLLFVTVLMRRQRVRLLDPA
jgi:hypothetical protein